MYRIVSLKPQVCAAIFVVAILNPTRAAEIIWTNTAGGTWATAANWNPNQVPTASDTAYITNDAAFTITVGAAAVVSNLFLGPGPGTSVSNRFDQNSTLTVHGLALVQSNGWFRMSGALNISNEFHNAGFFQWLDSPMRGNGRFLNSSNGSFQTRAAGAPTLGIRVFENFGYFLHHSDDVDDVAFSSNVTFTNHTGADLQLNRAGAGLRNASGADNTLFVNQGTVRVTSGGNGSPAYLTVPFLNFGTFHLDDIAVYVGGGTNYGLISCSAGTRNFSTVANTPLVFEPGTTFSTPAPSFFAAGHLIFNTPVILNSPRIRVGNASGGASTANQSLTINHDFTLSGEIEAMDGAVKILNPDANVNLGELTVSSSGVLTNMAALSTRIYRQANASTVNTGEIIVSNSFSFTGGTLRQTGGGQLRTLAGCATTIQNTGVASRNLIGGLWENFGTVSFAFVTSLSVSGGAGWINHSNAVIGAGGNSLPSNSGGNNWFVNYGTWQRNGQASTPTWALVTTNYGSVSANNTTMSFNQYYQFSGRTDLGNATVNGAQMHILGGELLGAATLGSSPSLYNAADFRPGNPRGLFTVAGPFTNAPTGVHHMEIAGTTGTTYDRVAVNGTAYLAGTLNVTFTNGFFPVIGSTFTAMTWTARSGAFDQILTPNYEFEITYTPTNLLLRASNALPNVTFTVSGGNTQLVCNPFQLTASATDLDGTVTNIDFLMNGNLLASSPGNSSSTSLEIDFPGMNLFVARARDNRGGFGYFTQSVEQVTLPLHVLTLGGIRNNGFKICMLGESGADYLAYATTNLDLPFAQWAALGLMERTNGIWRYFDAGAITNQPRRFYRALQQ